MGSRSDPEATGGFVVISGVFTDEATAFSKGRKIERIDGGASNNRLYSPLNCDGLSYPTWNAAIAASIGREGESPPGRSRIGR